MLATAAVLATVIITSATAIAEPGKNGPPGPEGNPNADPVESGSSASSSSPGNSANNPHGGAPGTAGNSSDPPASDNAVASPPPATPVGSSTAAEPAKAPEALGSGNGNGPADKITICHATGSETNPYVVITVSENSVTGNGHGNGPAHQNDEDIIPAGAGGTCPATVREPPEEEPPDDGDGGNKGKDDQGVLGESGGGPGKGGPGDAGPSGDGPSGHFRGHLPFTGMFVGLLLAVGVGMLSGGAGLRRVARRGAGDSGELPRLQQRRTQVTGQASTWTDSVAARTTELGDRIATLERSLLD